MLTNRDTLILQFIDEFGGITINQASKLFFNKSKYSNDLARKRLKKLAENENIKYENDWATNQRIYYNKKKPSSHSLILMNFYVELISLGVDIIEFQKEYKIDNICRPDAFMIFSHKGKAKIAFIEVDMQHKTDISKYEKLFDTNLFQNEYSAFPELIIISSSKDYSTDYLFTIKILDYKLKGITSSILNF